MTIGSTLTRRGVTATVVEQYWVPGIGDAYRIMYQTSVNVGSQYYPQHIIGEWISKENADHAEN